MIWLFPAAWLAIVVVAAPVLIHLLVHRRAERLAFPTLRFLRETRLAAMRRHVLDDVLLLAVRVAMLAAAVAACAAPLLVTSGRRTDWDRRVVRAIVADAGPDARAAAPRLQANAFRSAIFETASARDALARAVGWLESAPPSRREIVIASAFPLGSIAEPDVTAIPREIGVRFERTGALRISETVDLPLILDRSGTIRPAATLTGAQTSVHEGRTESAGSVPIDIVAPAESKVVVEAGLAAVLSRRVWAPPANRRARFVVVDGAVAAEAGPIRSAWIADAVARIRRDPGLAVEAVRVPSGLSEARFASDPWRTLVAAADGRPVAVAAESSGVLVVATAVPPTALLTPLLLRSLLNSLSSSSDLGRPEVVAIPERQLAAWSRPAAPVSPRLDTVDEDDRRWLWAAVLVLAAFETVLRRGGRAGGAGRAAAAEPGGVEGEKRVA